MPTTKIPKSAKRVFKGIIFDVYQWPQKMYDGANATFEAIKRQDTVIILPVYRDKIVVIKQQQPGFPWHYCLPAGRMDKPGERPRQTAVRELREETGLAPRKIKLWKKIALPGKVVHNLYIYIAQNCRKVGEQMLDNGERIKIMSLNFEEFLLLSDDPLFYEGELMVHMLRARLHKKNYQELKKAIFR